MFSTIIIYDIKQRKMRYRGNKIGQFSLRNKAFKSQASNLAVDLDQDQFDVLKKEARRIEIMTRMETRLKPKDSIGPRARPQSVVPKAKSCLKKPNFKVIQQQYFREKSLVSQALKTKEEPRPSEEGLLGQIKRYEQMTKQELIEKLISLQHLANTIFKRNKFLEEELRRYQINFQL